MHKLSDYAGKKVILYFYPKDNTAGCTKQACGFSERYPQFTENGAVILGVDVYKRQLHYRWLDKEGMPVWINSRGIVIIDHDTTTVDPYRHTAFIKPPVMKIMYIFSSFASVSYTHLEFTIW